MDQRNPRWQPPQKFSEYTLSRFSSPEHGLTSLPFGKMTQVIPAGADNVEVVVDLGQRFAFDGNAYSSAVVSSNGFIALGVTNASLILTGSTSNNSLIPAGGITPSGSVLFAPWFNDLQVATATNAAHPGVWFARDHGPQGVRSVVRWVCQSVVSPNPQHILTFECVLASNGEVQFRYATPVAVGSVTEAISGAGGATIGIFASGSYNFRDFSRDNTELGGAAYDPSYVDPAASPAVYRASLVSARDWPASRFGAVYSFQPRRALRRMVPRADLRALDGRTLTAPVQRPRSVFEKLQPRFFDDRKSIAFSPSVINLPGGLPRWAAVSMPNGRGMANVYSDVQVAANVVPSAVEPWLFNDSLKTSPPFCEVGQPEQDQPSSDFFSVGTQPSDAPGLSSPLRSKAIIRIELPLEFSTALSSTTASLYCYDASRGMMALVASSSRQAPSTNVGLACDSQLFGPTGHALMSGSHTSRQMNGQSVAPFTIGNPSGFANVSQPAIETTMQFLQTGSATLNPLYDPAANNIVPVPASLFIDRPFLVEKASVEFPLMAGPGWLNDRTRTVFNNVSTASIPPNFLNYQHSADVGGPCLTFGLVNCIARDRRDLILSGTIIPVGDSNVGSTFTYFRNFDINAVTKSLYEQTLEGFPAYGGSPSAIIAPNKSNGSSFTGSVRFNADARVTNGYLTQIFGLFYFGNVSSSVSWLANALSNDVIDIARTSAGSSLQNASPFCRSMSGFDPSGRSLFGKEHTAPSYASGTLFGITNPFLQVRDQVVTQLTSGAQFTGSYLVLPNVATYVGNSRPSPYLIKPSDNLAFMLAKHRPAKNACSRTICSTFANMYADKNGGALTGSHDVQVSTGTIRVTLYGSYLSAGTEHHDALPQQLNSHAASEIAAGGEPVMDQFEVEYRHSFAGSIQDALLTGTLVSMPSYTNPGTSIGRFVIGDRGRAFSITNAQAAGLGVLSDTSLSMKLIPGWEIAGSIRNVQCVSSTERFYDSMLPAFDGISRADGAQLVTYTDANYVTGSWAFFESNTGVPTTGDVPAQATNKNWMWAFPFEPRYSAVSRQTDIVGSFTTKGNYDGDVIVATDRKPARQLTVAVGFPESPPSMDVFRYKIVVDYFGSGTIQNAVGAPGGDVIKALYGFGDGNLRGRFNNGAVAGPTHFPTMRQTPITNSVGRSKIEYSTSPIIRGWKHGLANGFPLYSRAVFRRARYGQFRDMLEQRPDTKYFIEAQSKSTPTVTSSPVRVHFVDQEGRITKPESTWSQNLSFEATSSLPFFDGVQRNRRDPNAAMLNVGNISVRADAFGNVSF